jgi:alkanesulfonate monooxygenase SsuD/methylene tetrahydromethanopterin reductase-like flavin-dependent oxidoreductase (luciferase family)
VTWEGKTRAALLSQDVVPHLESGPFPAWIGVGGNPQSVIRAARLGFSLALAIIGGPPARFAAYSELFRRALEKFGQPPRPVLVHSPGHVAPTDEQAKAEFWPAWREVIALGATRFDLKYGLPGLTHDQLMTTIGLYGQQVVPRVRELLG